MLCYVISETDYKLAIENKIKNKPEIVFIGRTNNIDKAKSIASTFTCQTYIRVINKCIFIVCK